MESLYILKEDWKNLIILDACRYDMFKELNNIPGTLEIRRTISDHTSGFVNSNFKDYKGSRQDIYYINANPAASYWKYIDGTDLWKSNYATKNKFGVVLPGFMCTYIRTKDLPGCKHIIHFLQPHYPLIYEPDDSDLLPKPNMYSYDYLDAWKHGEASGWNNIIAGYKKNLSGVLNEVMKLLPFLHNGRTIITADHGELLGEHGCYGHGDWKIDIREDYNEIWEVPWFIVDRDGSDQILKQLKALGYV